MIPILSRYPSRRRPIISGGSPASPATGYNIWLKADSLSLSDGDPVSAWTDATGNHSASQSGSARPTFRAAGQNGLPAVQFDTSDDGMTLASATAYSILHHFIVMKSTTSTWGSYGSVVATSAPGSRGYLFSSGTTQFYSDQYPLAVRKNKTDLTSPFNLTTINSYMLLTIESNNTTGHSYTKLGDTENFRPGFFLCEMIGYPTVLGSTDRATTEDYLTAKWAL